MSVVPSSLRNRLVLGTVLVGLVFAVLFGVAATWRVRQVEDRAVTAALASRVDLVRDQVGRDGSLSADVGNPKTDLVQVLGPDGGIRASSPALANAPALVDAGTVDRSSPGVRSRVTLQTPDIDLAVLAVPIALAGRDSAPAGTGLLIVGVDAEAFDTATSDLVGLLVVGLAVVVLVMALLSWVLTGRALDSVTRLTENAEAIGPERLGVGLPLPHGDAELARLVGALNRMLVRLHDSHVTELAFAADAGHRLRTPVATLRAEAELAQRETDPAEQAAALVRIVGDADRLTSIIDRMLARTRNRSQPPEPVLRSLEGAEGRWRRQAEVLGIALTLHVDPDVTADIRSRELVDVAEPVLENALRYTPEHGSIHVDVRREPDGSLVVDLTNTGAAIPADLAPQVFDAWVSDRDASVAGGLGLWLARETARDAGGDVVLLDSSPGETTFRIELPAG